jgi:hypothetical protein
VWCVHVRTRASPSPLTCTLRAATSTEVRGAHRGGGGEGQLRGVPKIAKGCNKHGAGLTKHRLCVVPVKLQQRAVSGAPSATCAVLLLLLLLCAGWFQSSLLTAVAATGSAPYKQVRTGCVCIRNHVPHMPKHKPACAQHMLSEQLHKPQPCRALQNGLMQHGGGSFPQQPLAPPPPRFCIVFDAGADARLCVE